MDTSPTETDVENEDQLARAARDVHDAAAMTAAARSRRDALICRVVDEGMTAYRAAKTTGLTPQAVAKILRSGPPPALIPPLLDQERTVSTSASEEQIISDHTQRVATLTTAAAAVAAAREVGWPVLPAPQAYDALREVRQLIAEVRGVAARVETATLRGRQDWVPDSPETDVDATYEYTRAQLAALVAALDAATVAGAAAQEALSSIGSSVVGAP